MGHHVERVVEWCDRTDHSLQRLSLCEYLTLLAMWCEVTGKNLAIIQNAKLPSKTEHIKGSSNFIE